MIKNNNNTNINTLSLQQKRQTANKTNKQKLKKATCHSVTLIKKQQSSVVRQRPFHWFEIKLWQHWRETHDLYFASWRGARELTAGWWPEACWHLFPVLLKCLFITLHQLHLPLSPASRHANSNTPGLSRLIRSLISERREAVPPPLPQLLGSKAGEEDWLEAEGGGQKGRAQEGEARFTPSSIPNWFQSSSWTPGMRGTHCRLAVFAFAGRRKSDLRRRSQPGSPHPTSHIPRIATTKNEGELGSTVAPEQVSPILGSEE